MVLLEILEIRHIIIEPALHGYGYLYLSLCTLQHCQVQLKYVQLLIFQLPAELQPYGKLQSVDPNRAVCEVGKMRFLQRPADVWQSFDSAYLAVACSDHVILSLGYQQAAHLHDDKLPQ